MPWSGVQVPPRLPYKKSPIRGSFLCSKGVVDAEPLGWAKLCAIFASPFFFHVYVYVSGTFQLKTFVFTYM